MHILIIPSWYPTPDRPISGIFFLEQAQALQKAGHKVNVLVPPTLKSLRKLKEIRSVSDLKSKFKVEIYQGVKTYRTSIWKWIPLPHCRVNRYRLQRYGKKIFKTYLKNEGEPDIIHAHSIFDGGYLAGKLGQEAQIPVVLTEHSSAFINGVLSKKQEPLVKECLKKIDTLIAVGPTLKKTLQSYAPQREVKLLGNVINVDFFNLSTIPVTTSPFIFCLIAFFTPNKGIDILLKAFAKAFEDQDVILKIAGNGADRDSLIALAKRLNITEQVNFMGLLSREEVRNLLHRSHALVSASYVETFGVNLIEAMSCGKPVVATRSGGPEMFINEKNGILTAVGDIDSLAEAMQRMVKNYEYYDSEHIRAECVNTFGEAAITQQLEKIYQDTIEANAN